MDWYKSVARDVEEAAAKAALPPRTGGFDGDAWVWRWRQALPPDVPPDLTAETRLRIRPGSLEGANFEVSIAAWLESHRDVAASEVLWSQFYRPSDVERLKATGELTKELARFLRQGMLAVKTLAQRLPEISESRSQLLDELRARNLLDG